jgi:hypothetical protein
MLDDEFALLPPHFKNDISISLQDWQIIHPCFSRFPVGFRQVMPMLLASLVYHSQWLQENLQRTHPLFLTPLWTQGFIDRFRGVVVVNKLVCPFTGLRATGIPIHMTVMNRVSEMTKEITGVNFQQVHDSIVQRAEALGERLPAHISEHDVRNHGYGQPVPLMEVRLNEMMATFTEQLVNTFQSLLDKLQHNNNNNSATVNTNSNIPAPENPALYPMFFWGDKWHPVPENFQFPRCTVKTMWDLWLLERISLYKMKMEPLKQFE